MSYGLDFNLAIFERSPINTILYKIGSIGLATAPMAIQADFLTTMWNSTHEVNVISNDDKSVVSNYETFFLNVPLSHHPFKQIYLGPHARNDEKLI